MRRVELDTRSGARASLAVLIDPNLIFRSRVDLRQLPFIRLSASIFLTSLSWAQGLHILSGNMFLYAHTL